MGPRSPLSSRLRLAIMILEGLPGRTKSRRTSCAYAHASIARADELTDVIDGNGMRCEPRLPAWWITTGRAGCPIACSGASRPDLSSCRWYAVQLSTLPWRYAPKQIMHFASLVANQHFSSFSVLSQCWYLGAGRGTKTRTVSK